jgi:hypothetical protein
MPRAWAVPLTIAVLVVAFAGWRLGGLAVTLSGLAELDLPIRAAAVFAALTLMEVVQARIAARLAHD